jgi:hypothetical protein
VPSIGVASGVLFITEKFHPDYVGNLEHQTNFTFWVATLDLLQGPSGNPRPSGQLFLGHLALFPAKTDELAQKLSRIPGLTEICAVNGRGHKPLLDIIVVTG